MRAYPDWVSPSWRGQFRDPYLVCPILETLLEGLLDTHCIFGNETARGNRISPRLR